MAIFNSYVSHYQRVPMIFQRVQRLCAVSWDPLGPFSTAPSTGSMGSSSATWRSSFRRPEVWSFHGIWDIGDMIWLCFVTWWVQKLLGKLKKNYEMYAVAISAGWGSIHVMLHLGFGHVSLFWVSIWLHYIKKSDWSPRLLNFLGLGNSCWSPYQAVLSDPSQD